MVLGGRNVENINNFNIKIKEKLNLEDYKEINQLQNLCHEVDKVSLKLELDYKLSRSEVEGKNIDNLNEFLYYYENMLVGYIGICEFGGAAMEINGMVHPSYRRRGIFKKLFSLVKDEGGKRNPKKILLLSDNNSISGLEFIKNTGAEHHHSEYEMFLRRNSETNSSGNNVVLRRATNEDGREIAWQNSIYFNEEFKEENIPMPEEEEKCGILMFIAEVDNKVMGKVNIEIREGQGGIYGLGVIPEYRGRGYGREILTKAVKILQEKGAKDVMLQVEAKNKNALNLYKSCGFEETYTMDYYKL